MSLPRPTPDQRKWWVIAGVGIALMTAFAVWFGMRQAQGIQANQAGFTVKSNSDVELQWDVVAPQHKPIECTLIAEDNQRNVLGTKTVKLAASKYTSTRYHADIATTDRPVTATVSSCSYLK